MSVLDIESSEQDNLPFELLGISYGTTTHLITFADHDVGFEGFVYTATPGARGEISVVQTTEEHELEITLPINHAFVRRYLQQGLPPQRITMTLRRLYRPSEDVETIWIGEVTSMSADDDGTEATFRVPARGNEATKRLLPTVSTGTKCSHILYDTMCKIDSAGSNPDGIDYKLTTTVTYVSGRIIRLDLSNVPAANARRDHWCVGGMVKLVSTGEPRTISEQNDLNPGISTVTELTMSLPLVGLSVGSSVEVYAGCDHVIDGDQGCKPKFDNKDNFGGFPALVSKGTSAGTFSLLDFG